MMPRVFSGDWFLNGFKGGVFALALLAAGCTAAPPASVVPELSYDNIAPVRVAAAQVQVIDNYKGSLKLPNVEYMFHQTPDAAAQEMLKEKVVPAGVPGKVLRVYVDDASVVAQVLSPDNGILGVFKPEPGVKYKARVALRFELANTDAPDIILGHATIVADRTLTLDHSVSPAERDMSFFELDEALMKDLGSSLQTVVKGTFGQP